LITKNWQPSLKLNGLRILGTYILVNLAWVFFRAESISQSFEILAGIGNLNTDFVAEVTRLFNASNEFREMLISLVAGLPLFIVAEFAIGNSDFNQALINRSLIFRWTVYLILTGMIFLFGVLNSAPQFIYFQF
jgi:hypothetical protein